MNGFESIRLPAALPGGLDLSSLNARLKAGEIALDWTDVTSATAETLEALLKSLDLADHADQLGLDTVPNALSPAIQAALQPPAAPKPKRKKAVKQTAKATEPALFEAPPAEGGGNEPADEPSPAAQADSAPAPARVLRKLTGTQIRTELVDRILRDLEGPAGGRDEEIGEVNVRDRYLIGALAPKGQATPAEELDSIAEAGSGDEEDGRPDEGAVGKSALLPSSLGLTFAVEGDVSEITVVARWGRYERVESEEHSSRVWKRRPVEQTLSVPLVEGLLGPFRPDAEHPAVLVEGRARRLDGAWLVSLFLVNRQPIPSRNRDAAWLFQAGLEVRDAAGRSVFVRRRPLSSNLAQKPLEERLTAVLYRDAVELAVGHGVGVHWDLAPGDPHRAVRLETRAAPRFEVPAATPPTASEIPELTASALDMKVLAGTAPEELATQLLPLAEAYGRWIAEAEARSESEASGLRHLEMEARVALGYCRKAERRIREGIELLRNDPAAREAFRFANDAMYRQRIRAKVAEAARRGEKLTFEALDVPGNRTWYPFQLAFLLLNLPGATDLGHEDRTGGDACTADLLWFPTGGGKTEAYLGLAAYVMALRRRQGVVEGRSGEAGLAVLMRYTLRLLTLQQFQRAAALVCACEEIRREAPALWGTTPFRIGLWVGKRVTPNTTEQSAEAVKRIKGTGPWQGTGGTPHQLLNCPWCGSEIKPGRDVTVETYPGGRARTLQYCGDPLGRCLFTRAKSSGEGLPILVVDEEIYRNPPALLIATVDKFAQMPWNGAVQTLFGQVSGFCERHGYRTPDVNDADSHHASPSNPKARTNATPLLRPPDLIIQDELHLISGPLGTLVGLYETAVDQLSSWTVNGKTVRPKLVASTATIRRAAEQTHALFARRVEVFPPPGIDVGDSFFSRRRAPSDETPGRLYLGLCAQGKRMKAALIRAYTAAMASAQALYQECGEDADPWMTTVGYFGSMRELGGVRRLVEDDIASRLQKMDRRGLAARRISPYSLEELTSRRSSTEIPKVLDRLEVKFPAPGATRQPGRHPLDVVLATNMISVGVDVQRLGLMIACGQPKSTAEYIQATSRVGRRHPGLVLTVFNWTRPRDLSHYESFEHYHATFHQHVEALSVTPFAARAQDRGLFAVLTSLVRLGGLDLNPNDAARIVKSSDPIVVEAIRSITERALAVTQNPDAGSAAKEMLLARLDQWVAAAGASGLDLAYRKLTNRRGLLKAPSEEPWGEFTCLNSLRDVEPPSTLLLVDDKGVDQVGTFVPRPTPSTGAEPPTDGEAAE